MSDEIAHENDSTGIEKESVNEPSFADYLRLVWQTKGKYPQWRIGQTYWNVLVDIRPDLAQFEHEGRIIDPYHVDARIPDFLTYVAERW